MWDKRASLENSRDNELRFCKVEGDEGAEGKEVWQRRKRGGRWPETRVAPVEDAK